jgi:hypothetical protein
MLDKVKLPRQKPARPISTINTRHVVVGVACPPGSIPLDNGWQADKGVVTMYRYLKNQPLDVLLIGDSPGETRAEVAHELLSKGWISRNSVLSAEKASSPS